MQILHAAGTMLSQYVLEPLSQCMHILVVRVMWKLDYDACMRNTDRSSVTSVNIYLVHVTL